MSKTTSSKTTIKTTNKTTHRVFVYGSLLSGLHNHRVIASETTKFLGDGRTVEGGWAMRDLGSFPALVANEDGGPVVGEVYEVDDATMRRLDALEGYPTFYGRKQVVVATAHDELTCWIYYMDRPAVRNTQYVEGNDWRTHHAAKKTTTQEDEEAEAAFCGDE